MCCKYNIEHRKYNIVRYIIGVHVFDYVLLLKNVVAMLSLNCLSRT